MLTRGFGRKLRESSYQFFEDMAHLLIANCIRIQIDTDDLRDHRMQQVRPVKSSDMGTEIKAFDYLSSVPRKTMYIFTQVRADMTGIMEQASEFKRADVVKIPACGLGQYCFGLSVLSCEGSVSCYNLGLSVCEEAIKPSEHH